MLESVCKKLEVLICVLFVVLSFLVFTGYARAEGDFVANWDFENNFEDDWGTHDGTPHGIDAQHLPGFTELGVDDGSAALDLYRGQEQYVTVPDSPDLRTNSFSITAWVRPLAYSHCYRTIVSKYCPDTKSGYILYMDDANHFKFKIGTGSNSYYIVTPDNTAATGQWSFVVATFEQTGTSGNDPTGKMKLFVDGVLQASSADGIHFKPNTTDYYFRIGCDYDGSSKFNFWHGLIDNVRYYSKKISSDTIADLYAASAPQIMAITFNINEGGIWNGQPTRDTIIDFLKPYKPDILLFQECNDWDDAELEYYKNKFGMLYGFMRSSGRHYKVAILSKYPLPYQFFIPTPETFFFSDLAEANVQVTSNRILGVANVQFSWWGDPDWDDGPGACSLPSPDCDPNREYYSEYNAGPNGSYWRQCDFLTNRMEEYWAKSFPFIIGGDWNHYEDPTWPFGEGIHSQIQNLTYNYFWGTMSMYGLDALREFYPNECPKDTFYVTQEPYYNKIDVTDCKKLVINPPISTHQPIYMKFLMKN